MADIVVCTSQPLAELLAELEPENIPKEYDSPLTRMAFRRRKDFLLKYHVDANKFRLDITNG